MARAASQPRPLEFYGPPRGLRSREIITGVEGRGRVRLPESLSGAGAAPIEFLDIRRLRVRLPQHTPPGDYSAQLETDSQSYPVALSVEPYESLKASGDLLFEARPGRAADAELSLSNRGNVSSDIPESCDYWLFEQRSLEDAVIHTFHEKTADPEKLFGILLKRLRDATGGRSKCRVTAGSGPLAPGAERVVKLRAFLPKQLTPERSYVGLMTLGPMYQGITVHVTKNERGSKK
ncbi:MAG: hypothetical protein QOF14_1864 [Hyphomicrobiales bacterium]|jgi:hypothetical protein|nr:hypothetical protein [Hyphomicrobiales bacterium]